MESFTNLNLSYWFLQTLAMLITAALLPNLRVTNILGALLIVIALAFVNSKVWDAALFFQIPNELTYQTAALLITNGLIFWILVKLIPGIEVSGFLAALVAPVVFSFTSLLISKYSPGINWVELLDQIIAFLTDIRDNIKEQSSSAIATPVPSVTPANNIN